MSEKVKYYISGRTNIYFFNIDDIYDAVRPIHEFSEVHKDKLLVFEFLRTRDEISEDGEVRYVAQIRLEETRTAIVDTDTGCVEGKIIEEGDMGQHIDELTKEALKKSGIKFDVDRDCLECEVLSEEEIISMAEDQVEANKEHEWEMEHGW